MLERRTPRLLCGTVIVACVATSSIALATHNSWTLSDNAQYCHYRDGGSTGWPATYYDGFTNNINANVYAYCPVNLGGQFNGQNGGSLIQLHATVPSSGSAIYYYDGSTTDYVWCRAEARGADESIYMSQSASSDVAGYGYGTLTLSSRTGWGGTLGNATMNVAIRSLAYICYLPVATSFGASSIRGYRTNICANNSQCDPGF